MATHKIETKGWHAIESSDLVGSKHILTVTGEVQVPAGNDHPHLKEHAEENATLKLDLSITQKGIGDQHVQFKKVEYVKDLSRTNFQHVDIFFDGQMLEKIKVEHRPS